MPDEVSGEKTSTLDRVRQLRIEFEQALAQKGFDKPSVADYARLLQLERELEGDAPKDISVLWVNTLDNDCND